LETNLIYALHGFLGLPSDWETWRKKLVPSDSRFISIDLWNDPILNCSLSFSDWTKAFINQVKLQIHGVNSHPCKISLWGYSMGGRLALSALTQAPELFHHAMILSANPGLDDQLERVNRLQKDLEWAEKFLSQDLPWSLLMEEWDQQPVFNLPDAMGDSPKPLVNFESATKFYRKETDFDRTRLAMALDHWSIARQPNLWLDLNKINFPIDWHVGSLDEKYVAIAKRAQSVNSLIRLTIHKNRGHRLLEKL